MVASVLHPELLPSGYVHLSNGYTAEYHIIGTGDPLIIIPGLAGGVGLLQPLIEQLSSRFRVITYQLRGERQGVLQRGFPFGQYADDLRQIMTSLRLERPGLVGVSFGGAIALDFATRHAARLSFLAVQGAGMSYKPGIFGAVARRVLDRFHLPEDNPYVNQFFSVLIGSRRRQGDLFDFVVSRCWKTDQSVMAHRFALLDDYDIERRLEKVRVPTLVFAPDRDILVDDAEARALARQVPDGRCQPIEGAGHLAFVTHSVPFSQQVVQFAGGQSACM